MSEILSNPFAEMLGVISEVGSIKNTPGIMFGVIKSVEPLLVETQGIVLDSNFISLTGRLKPYTSKCTLTGLFDINCNWTPTLSTYDMPNKTIGLGANSSASVTGGDGTVAVSVSTNITGDSHSHSSHTHTSSTLSKITGQGTFDGSIDMLDYSVKAGDKVIILCTNDKQEYVVIDKF